MSKPLVEYVEVDGINLRVATQKGRVGLPLLLFNGIGANLELCFPFGSHAKGNCDLRCPNRASMNWRHLQIFGLARHEQTA